MEKKYYDDYKKDVMIRAIPEWFDKVAELYQEWAQAAKELSLLKYYNDGDDALKAEIAEKFPLIGLLSGYNGRGERKYFDPVLR